MIPLINFTYMKSVYYSFSITSFIALLTSLPVAAKPLEYSGIYPHLTMFNDEGECGTGAVVPWADRLWIITYGPHLPKGSSDKLYEITPDLEQIVRPESIGGTPANRMIHPESQQLFIGPYVIDAKGSVRTIPYDQMYGRHTGLARHLTNPSEKIVFATMEEGIYEVDVNTLKPTTLWTDEQIKDGKHADLPGYHGKGFYSSQGRYVYANNGDHAKEALSDPSVPSGVLASWDGKADAWTVVRRNQFTEVTGPGGISGSDPNAPLWSIGWDHRSLILMLLDGGKWHSFRLPKTSHSYDGAHGWNTEWPRIREIGETDLLMTMHGAFWKFPKSFSAKQTAGITPRSSYLKVIGDFARWGDHVVMGCDDAAKNEFLNKHPLKGALVGPGQSQSNLWFVKPSQLDSFGPTLGRGAVWVNDTVKAQETSEPFLFSGFEHRSLQLSHSGASPLTIRLEIDIQGNGTWKSWREITLPAKSGAWTELTETGAWIRLTPVQDATGVTAQFHYRGADPRTEKASELFTGVGVGNTSKAILLARGGNLRTLRCVAGDQVYDLNAEMKLVAVKDAAGATWTTTNAAIPTSGLGEDAASAYWQDAKGIRWRIPKGKSTEGNRICREICTERNLLNAYGTFYEFPAQNAGGFPKIRPVATHERNIFDYASYRGLLVLSGINESAQGKHIIKSDDGKLSLWVGGVDDLWALGKPRGKGGPWKDSQVSANKPSDPYLITGYDQKRLELTADKDTTISLEANFTGLDAWNEVVKLDLKAGQQKIYHFPAAFGAYWVRLTSTQPIQSTATFVYE
jgi:hypothetical protein